jgi:hypothetical protein
MQTPDDRQRTEGREAKRHGDMTGLLGRVHAGVRTGQCAERSPGRVGKNLRGRAAMAAHRAKPIGRASPCRFALFSRRNPGRFFDRTRMVFHRADDETCALVRRRWIGRSSRPMEAWSGRRLITSSIGRLDRPIQPLRQNYGGDGRRADDESCAGRGASQNSSFSGLARESRLVRWMLGPSASMTKKGVMPRGSISHLGMTPEQAGMMAERSGTKSENHASPPARQSVIQLPPAVSGLSAKNPGAFAPGFHVGAVADAYSLLPRCSVIM